MLQSVLKSYKPWASMALEQALGAPMECPLWLCCGGQKASYNALHTGYVPITCLLRHSYLGSNVGVMWE
jgi:hypothetical protein